MIIDHTEIKWPLGLTMIFVGLFLLISAVKSKYSEYICPKCENVLQRKNECPGICPDCEISLKKLDGYFEMQKQNN